MTDLLQKTREILAKNDMDLDVFGIWKFGSTVYGNKEPEDIDLVVVVDNNNKREHLNTQCFDGDITLNVMCFREYVERFKRHDIQIMECNYIIDNAPVYQSEYFAYRNKELLQKYWVCEVKLRHSFAAVAQNAYAKAKKKMVVEKDRYIPMSMKSLWHSIRILEYGRQLATVGKIDAPQACNHYYKEICNDYVTAMETSEDFNAAWAIIHAKYKPIVNEYATAFRAVAPKE